jgi:hypothetical protein
MNRSRLLALGLCVLGAGAIWVFPTPGQSSGTQMMSLVVLAALGALLASRGWFRRLVAVLIVLLGVGIAVDGGLTPVIAGVLIVAGGVVATVAGQEWPSMSGRYERKAGPAQTDMWAALDRGEDPTTTPR